MTVAALESYLHRQIPISARMGVRVLVCSESGATLAAPLVPNVNHHATVFGGSASALAILAGWTWLYAAMAQRKVPVRLVIQRNTIEYLAPITADFGADCHAPDAAKLERFYRTLKRHGKARIDLAVTLGCQGVTTAKFSGEYVAVILGDGVEE